MTEVKGMALPWNVDYPLFTYGISITAGLLLLAGLGRLCIQKAQIGYPVSTARRTRSMERSA